MFYLSKKFSWEKYAVCWNPEDAGTVYCSAQGVKVFERTGGQRRAALQKSPSICIIEFPFGPFQLTNLIKE